MHNSEIEVIVGFTERSEYTWVQEQSPSWGGNSSRILCFNELQIILHQSLRKSFGGTTKII